VDEQAFAGETAVDPAPAADQAIVVRGLRKDYGQVQAVAGVDLEVQRGEIFALLGPNGAGKTTTVEILEGYRDRTAGEVRVLGHDPAERSATWKARIGIVLQSTSDNADLSVDEVVRHFRTFYPAPRDADEVIAAVGLSEKRDAKVRTLSGGQRRRLDVALGILGDPELIFMDEPTTGFDPEARRLFWDLIDDLRAEGTTILLTTHYLDEAERLADRVGVIAAGRIIEVGTPDELGGRAEAACTVSWVEDGERRSMATDSPTALVTELAARLGGGEIPELAVSRPTLEEVYLRMIASAERTEDPAELPAPTADQQVRP
jgi:ABC-2 type transport system ATP-binding protein